MTSSDSTGSTGCFELMLEEQAAPAKAGYGYNPYDTYPNAQQTGVGQRQADLRRLSDWIRTQRQVAQLKKSGE